MAVAAASARPIQRLPGTQLLRVSPNGLGLTSIFLAVGGTLMDLVGGPERGVARPQAAMWLGVALFGVGVILLRPVDEHRREP